MTGPYRRCEENGNGYFKDGTFVKLKPHQRRFENTTLTKVYSTFEFCPICGGPIGGRRDTSQLNRCRTCGRVTVVTMFNEIPKRKDDDLY